MKFQKALRLQKLPPYIFHRINERKKELRANGIELTDLGMGDPDLPTPAPIVEKLIESVQKPENHRYPPYPGITEFRKAVSHWMERRFSVNIQPDTESVGLIGSKEGIVHFVQCYVNPGDFVLIPDPGYPSYANAILLSGGTPLSYPLTWENQFRPKWSEIPDSVWKSIRMVLVNFPHNPTSATVEIDTYRELVERAKRFGFIILSDAAYSEHAFNGLAPSILQAPGGKDCAIEMFTCSKSYNMTGWRVGFAVGNSELVSSLIEMKSCVDTGIFKAVQWAAIAALEGDERELVFPTREVFDYRRRFFKDELERLGYQVFDGGGSFYLWIKTPKAQSSMDFSWSLMERGVVVTPGVGFGSQGEGYFRVALTVPEEQLRKALAQFPKLR